MKEYPQTERVLTGILEDKARTHESHFSPQHIKDLRQLIETRFTHDLAERGDSRIVLFGPHGTCTGFSIDHHRAELENPENLAVQTDTVLREQNRPG